MDLKGESSLTILVITTLVVIISQKLFCFSLIPPIPFSQKLGWLAGQDAKSLRHKAFPY